VHASFSCAAAATGVSTASRALCVADVFMIGLAILQGLDIRLDAEVQLVNLGQDLGELLQLGSILCPLLCLISKLL